MPGAERARAAVVDASVAVKWVVDERGGRAAAAFLPSPILWLAPRLMVVGSTPLGSTVSNAMRSSAACQAGRVLPASGERERDRSIWADLSRALRRAGDGLTDGHIRVACG